MLIKIRILLNTIYGFIYKWLVDIGFLDVPALVGSNNKVVVSLTSYGRRVKSCVVYYALVSMLRQSTQPSRIILWLAEDEWNDSILPKKLREIRKKNIEIGYCEDLRSYIKLIPTLSLCPESTIITIDDDMIYSRDTVKTLLDEHSKHLNDIICLSALHPVINNGIPQQYILWKEYRREGIGGILFPCGVGAVLYPAHSLCSDVMRSELFLKLCPLADDIWFWFCGLKKGTIKRYVKKRGKNISFDTLYQYFHRGSALTHRNRFEDQNDKQFQALFTYYNAFIDTNGQLQEINL